MNAIAHPRAEGAPSDSGTNFGRGWIPQSRDIGLPGEAVRGDRADGAGDYGVPLDGARWTPEVKVRFLHILSGHGNVRVAAAAVGLSRQGAYLARRRDGVFARGWDAALVLARRHAEAVLAERALEGIAEEVWFRGELVGVRRRFDARLLLAHLGRLDRAAALSASKDAEAGFDRALAGIAGLSALDTVEAMKPDRGDHVDAVVAEHAWDQWQEDVCWSERFNGACEVDDAAFADLETVADEAGAAWDAARDALHAAVDDVAAGRPPAEVKAMPPAPARRGPRRRGGAQDGVKGVKQARGSLVPVLAPPLAPVPPRPYAPGQQRESARWPGSGSMNSKWGSGSTMPSAAPLPKPTTSCSPR